MSVRPRADFWRRYGLNATLLAVTIVAGLFYFAAVPNKPPGFYIDESSVAFNAHLIAETGRDEHGKRWPLFFRSFGEYKNPAYIYLLAALFKVTGPSIITARLLSAALGVAAAVVIGFLGWQIIGRREAWPLLALTTLLTPWLFELSRLVFEVALFPLALALFLLWLHRLSQRQLWPFRDAAVLAASLALITYTYSIGRLLGPLLALGLALFATRNRLPGLFRTWTIYGMALLPAYLFHRNHLGALTARFSIVTYINPEASFSDTAVAFLRHYTRNIDPWRMLALGDPDIDQLTHIDGCGLVLATTGILAAVGLWRFVRDKRRDRWWLYIVYGLLVSPIPASLTKEYFHTLRLSPLIVFVLAISILGLDWFFQVARNSWWQWLVIVIFAALTVPQGAFFLWKFHTAPLSERRLRLLDVDYTRKIFEPALSSPSRPIYIADALGVPGYIQAYWYATLRGVPRSEFLRLADDALPPKGALTITTEESCHSCKVLSQSLPYVLYVSEQEPRVRTPLPDDALRAGISLPQPPTILPAGAKQTLMVRVRNAGAGLWLGRERSGGKYQVSLGNHWLAAEGRVIRNDDGRSVLLSDLGPGEQAEMSLVVNTPERPGNYILEIDMLQEGVSWFGLKGSQTVRLPVRIE